MKRLWSIGRLPTIGFLVVLLLLASISVFSYYATVQFSRAADWAKRSVLVSRTIQEILNDLSEAQAQERGYIITGDERFLSTYSENLTELKQDTKELLDLTDDNPEHQLRLKRLNFITQRLMMFLQKSILSRRARGIAEATKLVTTGEGERLRQEARNLLKEMQDSEDTLFKQREKTVFESERRTYLVIFLGMFLSLLLYLAILFALNREAFQRGRTEKTLLQREEQLRQSQKMEAVGRLAGGVAHDFNNVLTAIGGYSSFLYDGLDPEDPKREDVQEIQKAAARAAALTRQLLAFSRQQVLKSQVLGLNSIVTDIQRMLQRLIGEDVTLDTYLASNLGAVQADSGQIEQVLVNLTVNSRDAMPKGGKITLETANVELGEDYAQAHPGVIPGPYVMLAVTDNGVGMDKQTLSRIFEPFFTTKAPGKGTGLGLATVYGIVKQSGGSIFVYSEPGKGTSFKIYLPRIKGTATPHAVLPPETQYAKGSETILLVEDDEMVRKMINRILVQNKYTVIEAARPELALDICRGRKEPIHLLLTDMVMPEMRGDELAKHVLELRPNTKVIFMSGYTEAGIIQNELLRPDTNYLQKPIAPADLIRMVREVLDAP